MVVSFWVVIHIPLRIYISLCDGNETGITSAAECISISMLNMITTIILIDTVPLRSKLKVVTIQESSENVGHSVEL